MSIKFELPKLRKDEKIEIFLRKHTMFLVIPLSVIIAIIIMPTIFIFYLINFTFFFSQPPIKNLLIIIASSYALIMCGYALYTWFRYYFSYLIVTNQRLIEIEQKGLFNRNTSELELIRIEDVKALIHGVLATFFHYGDVLVETAGATSENFLFEKIPHASYVSTKILELSQKALEEQQPEVGGRMASVLLEGKERESNISQTNQEISEGDLPSQTTDFSNLKNQELEKNDFISDKKLNNPEIENKLSSYNTKEIRNENEIKSKKNDLKNYSENKFQGGILYERGENDKETGDNSGGVELK